MTTDILIVGAGHNGLVCAFYLASAGLKVKLVEKRQIVGGAAVTEEFHPGFRNSVASYTVSLLNPKVIADMNLSAHGLSVVERRASNFLPQPDGRYLLTGPGRTEAEIAKFSKRDAAAYPRYIDPSLAPEGAHVASLFCQHVAPALPGGASWDDHRDEVADLMIRTVDDYAPGFANSIVGRQINSPLDLERTFGLVGGDIFHGALSLDQLFSARPMLGYADYRSPLKGLYLCGSGTHPGGGVTGAPGHNAAHAILRDFRPKLA